MKDELSRKEREYASLQLQAETLKRQHQETLHHVSVVKEQLAAKEKQVTMLQTDVSLTVFVSLFSVSLTVGLCLLAHIWLSQSVGLSLSLSLSHLYLSLSLSLSPQSFFFNRCILVCLSVCLRVCASVSVTILL